MKILDVLEKIFAVLFLVLFIGWIGYQVGYNTLHKLSVENSGEYVIICYDGSPWGSAIPVGDTYYFEINDHMEISHGYSHNGGEIK